MKKTVRILIALLLSLGQTYAADYYWIGGTGQWSDISHWATSSGGGITHVVVPSINDNVFFDANSFTAAGQTVTVNNLNATCSNIDWTGATNNPTFTGNGVRVSGSFTLIPNMTVSNAGQLVFEALAAAEPVDFAGKTWPADVVFNSLSGGWVLNSDLNQLGFRIQLTAGDLNASNRIINAAAIASTGSVGRSLNLTNATVNLVTGSVSVWNFSGSNVSINSSNSTINVTGGSPIFQTNVAGVSLNDVLFSGTSASALFTGNGTSYNNLSFDQGALINGVNTVVNLSFTPGKVYSLETAQQLNVTGSWTGSGTCDDITIIQSTAAQTNLNVSPNISFDYVSMSGLVNVGTGTITVSNGIDLGGNVNINILALSPRDLYWVGGTGNWSDDQHWSLSSGGAGGECVPLSIDNVFFDNNSFTNASKQVTVDPASNGYCHNMTWTSNLNPIFNYGTGTAMVIYGSLELASGMTCGGTRMIFSATDLGNTVKSNAVYITSAMEFAGAGGEWTLLDDLNLSNYTLLFNQGTLNAANRVISANSFFSTTTDTRVLDITNSTINLINLNGPASSQAYWDMQGTGMTLSALNSHVILHQEASTFISVNGNLVYHDVSFIADRYECTWSGTATYNDVFFGSHARIVEDKTADRVIFSPGYTYYLNPNITITLTNNLVAVGNCEEQITILTEPSSTASFSKNGGLINVLYTTIENIVALGSASFNAANSVPLGTVTGWNFTPRAGQNFYWIGNEGRWHNGSNWSFSSGGAAANCIPGPADDVFFDANSFNGAAQVVTVDTLDALCQSMDWTGATGSPVFACEESLFIYGSLILNPVMAWQPTQTTWFVSFSPGNTITTNGITFPTPVWFQRQTGGWILQDEFIVYAAMYFMEGDFNTNAQDVTVHRLLSTDILSRNFTIDNSDFTCYAGGNAWQVRRPSLSFSGLNSHLIFPAAGADMRTYPEVGSSIAYHDVSFLGAPGVSSLNQGNTSFGHVYWASDGVIIGDNTFDTISFTAGGNYALHSGRTQVVNGTINAMGSCNDVINIAGTTSGTQATITKPSGTIDISRCTLTDIEATGGATFNASATTDLGNNTGWNIIGNVGMGLYWIGGTGNWSDPNHWALTSGGVPSGCIPTPIDDVYFDQNSFTGPSETVTLDIDGDCHSMWWTGALFNPTFVGSSNENLNIYGSLELNPNMTIGLFSPINFFTTEPLHTIEAFGYAISLKSPVSFAGTGDWTLLDTLASTSSIFFDSGTLNGGNGTVIATTFESSVGLGTRVLNMDNSEWNLTFDGLAWNMYHQGITLNKGASDIRLLGNGAAFNSTGDLNYNNLWFHGLIGASDLNTEQTHFDKVFFYGSGDINGSNYYDTLQFSPGNNYLLSEQDTQYIAVDFLARGNNCFPIVIHSQDIPSPAYIFKSGGLVDSDFLEIKAIHAVGGANFYAGVFSIDAGFNLNWNFSNSGNYQYGLGPDTTVLLCSNLDTFHIVTFNFNGGIAWQWHDGFTGANYPAVSSGLYVVTVFFANNCFTTDSVFLNVDTLQPFVENEANICLGDSVTVSINGGRPGFGYMWNTGDTTAEVTLSPMQDSTFWVTVDFGLYTCIDTFRINVNDPGISFTKQDVLCFGQADGAINAAVSDSLGPVTYSWAHGPSSSSLSGLTAGWYVLQTIDSLGCIARDSIEILELPALGINFSYDPIPCFGDSTKLTWSGSGGGASYVLDFVDNSLDPDKLPAGTHQFALVDSNGCRLDTSVIITQPLEIDVIGSVNDAICSYGADGDISLAILGGTAPHQVTWSNGDTGLFITGLETGVYQATVTDAAGCTSLYVYVVNSVSNLTAAFTADVVTGKRPLVINFTNLSFGADDYEWHFRDSLNPTTTTDVQAVFNSVGTQTVMLVANDLLNGCSDTSYITIVVESNPEITDPDVFTPNGDGINDVFYFDTEDVLEFHALIFNRWGGLVYEWKDQNKGWDGINLRGEMVSPGTYFYILQALDLGGKPYAENGYVSVFY